MSTPVLARDLMSRPVRRLTAATPLRDAAAFLIRHGISGAPVVDPHGTWVGVFTLNDLARHVQERLVRPAPEETVGERTLESRDPLPEQAWLPPADFDRTPVGELMTPGMFTVFPEATLEEVVRSMSALKIHRVFVIDEARGELEGVITTLDVLRWLERQHAVVPH